MMFDFSLTIENLSNMYCMEPANKKLKMNNDRNETLAQNTHDDHNIALSTSEIIKELPSSQPDKSPILENKERSYKKSLKNDTYSVLKRLSKFPRTVLGDNVVESKFFSPETSVDIEKDLSKDSITIEESPEKISKNPFKVKSVADINRGVDINNPGKTLEIDTQCIEILDSQEVCSQKENSPYHSPEQKSPILEPSPRFKKEETRMTEDFDNYPSSEVIENTYPYESLITPVDSQVRILAKFLTS